MVVITSVFISNLVFLSLSFRIYTKIYEQIWIKTSGKVRKDTRINWSDFWSDPNHCLDAEMIYILQMQKSSICNFFLTQSPVFMSIDRGLGDDNFADKRLRFELKKMTMITSLEQ